MKAKSLTIKNIGLVEDAKIEFDKPLILFYGEIQQGKTTILNAVKWVFGGAFPSDIIRNGESEAMVRLDLDCGSVTREWYRARNGDTKSRPVCFERDGRVVPNPISEIKQFLNPFLLDQDYLRNMSELERKKYFAATFAIDTAGLDEKIRLTEGIAVELRAKLKGYGDIDLTPVEQPQGDALLKAHRQQIIDDHVKNQNAAADKINAHRAEYQTALDGANIFNASVRETNFQIDQKTERVKQLYTSLEQLRRELVRAESEFFALQAWLKDHDQQAPMEAPVPPDSSIFEVIVRTQPDTSQVDEALRKAAADQVRFEQYQLNQSRASRRAQDEHEIEALDATVRELRKNKIAKLKQSSEATGIAGLEFDEAGNFRFEGSEAGMLSTSQIMRLSSLLSAKYPPGFGLDLIDRAESLGKSVFEFVERAKAENKTILAAVVGERPAQVPAEVGVFVVEGGVVK